MSQTWSHQEGSRRLDKGTRSETMSENEVQERETVNVQGKQKGISPQRSLVSSPHCKRSQGSQGKGLDHDIVGLELEGDSASVTPLIGKGVGMRVARLRGPLRSSSTRE